MPEATETGSSKVQLKKTPAEKLSLKQDYLELKDKHEKPLNLAGATTGETPWQVGQPQRRVATEAGTQLRKNIKDEFKKNRTIENQQRDLQEALTDELTGCASRKIFFRDLIEVEAAQTFQQAAINEGRLPDTPEVRKTTQAIIIMIDMQGLKEVNDKNGGHWAGDEYLRAVGSKLTGRLLKINDTKARMGGDEFGLILKGVDKDEARAAWSRVDKALKSIELPHIGVHGINANAGFAVFDRHHVEESVNKADRAMYKAKDKFYKSEGKEDVLEDADDLTPEELANTNYRQVGRTTSKIA